MRLLFCGDANGARSPPSPLSLSSFWIAALHLPSFYIDRFPVTVREYSAYLQSTQYRPKDAHNWLGQIAWEHPSEGKGIYICVCIYLYIMVGLSGQFFCQACTSNWRV